MKKYIVMMASLVAINLSCIAITVPKAVADAFEKKFPGATNIKWGKENTKEYEAEFKMNGKAMSANFSVEGNWMETEAAIEVSGLPAAAASTITAKYPGYTISGVFKIEKADGKTTYEAEIKKGSKKMEVILASDGTIIK